MKMSLILALILSPLDAHADFRVRSMVSIFALMSERPTCQTLVADAEHFLVKLYRGQVFEDGIIITADHRLLSQTTVLGWNPKRPLPAHHVLERKIPSPVRFEGTLAVLASVGADEYYHWLLQIAARYAILEQKQIAYDKLYLMPLTHGFQRETLEVLGIPADKVYFGAEEKLVQAHDLIVPSIPTHLGHIRPEAVKFLRDKFLQEENFSEKPRRKLYISRADAKLRQIVNEGELWAMLEPMGFEKVLLSGHHVREQARLFAQADVIVAPHGSGLANLVFARDGARIIEIHISQEINGLFGNLSRQLGLEYHAIQSTRGTMTDRQVHEEEKIYLSKAKLREIYKILAQGRLPF